MPTLIELAGLSPIPRCPTGPTQDQPLLCTEGLSAAPLFAEPERPWKKAAFSQYARPAPVPDNGFPADAFTPPLHSGPVLPRDIYYPQLPGRSLTTEGVMSFTIRVDRWRCGSQLLARRASATICATILTVVLSHRLLDPDSQRTVTLSTCGSNQPLRLHIGIRYESV